MRWSVISLIVGWGCKGEPPPTTDTPADCTIGFADRDGDGFGNPALQTSDCQEPIAANDLDCDDLLTAVNPGATEVCDGIDNDCNGLVDLDDPAIEGAEQWDDSDEDGYGAGASVLLCEPIDGWVTNDDDCDDTRADLNPGQPELCDNLDNDCDGDVDDDDTYVDPASTQTFYIDADGDGWGGDSEVHTCLLPDGAAVDGGDCDDLEPLTWPGAPEICNGQDSDCDGAPDGSSTQLDTCADFEGSWSGSYTVSLTLGSQSRTCDGTLVLTVDRTATPPVQGNLECTLDAAAGSFPLTHTGAFSGWVTRDGTAWGSAEAFNGTERDWTGSMLATDFVGGGDGLQIDGADAWDMSFSWAALPTTPSP